MNEDSEPTVYDYISKYHFPIIGYDQKSGKEILVGTCIIVNLLDRFFLVTASHVMNARENLKDKELWIWNFSDGCKFTITEDIIGDDSLDLPHHHDIAVVELNVSRYGIFKTIDFQRNCFIGLHRIIGTKYFQPALGEDTFLIIAGYPSSMNKLLKNRYKKPKLLIHSTDHFLGKMSNDVIDELLTISARWDDENLENKGANLPALQGMSGGGVWVLSNKSEFNPRLYAISVACLSREKRIVAVKMAVVLSMIKCFFPDTILDKVNLPFKHEIVCDKSVKLFRVE